MTSYPSFVLRIRMPNINCKAKPQRTGLHFTCKVNKKLLKNQGRGV